MTLQLIEPAGGSADFSHLGVFDVMNYANGASINDGTTDAAGAIRAAYDAAFAAGGGIVQLPPGTLYLNKSGQQSCLFMKWGHPGWIVFRGAGRGVTTLKFGTIVNFMSFLSSGVGDMQYLAFEDFSINVNGKSANWANTGCLYYLDCRYTDTHDIRAERIDIYNMGAANDGPWRTGMELSGYYGDSGNTPAQPTRNIYNMTARDINIGGTGDGPLGGGGNYGITWQMFKYSAANPSDWTSERALNEWVSPIYMDNMVVDNVEHWSGLNQENNPTFHACSNIIVGSQAHGGRLRINNFRGHYSRDDGIEINSFLDVQITNPRVELTNNANIYLANLGGMAKPEQQTILVDGAYMTSVECNSVRSAGALGHITVRNGSSAGIIAEGRFRSITLQNMVLYADMNYGTTSNYTQHGVVVMNQEGDRSSFSALNVEMYVKHTQNGGTNVVKMFDFGEAADLTLNIAGVRMKLDLESTTQPRLYGFWFANGGRSNFQETFTGPGFTGAWSFDSDVSTSMALAGTLTATANLSLEKRFILVNSGDYYFPATGPVMDGAWGMYHAPGAVLTAFKGGAIARSSSDATTYIDAYVTDDGTNSYLCLDQVLLGTRTSLLSASTNGGATTVTDIATPVSGQQSDRGIMLASRVANGTPYSIRLIKRGGTYTADYWATAARKDPAAGSATATATATLATTSQANRLIGVNALVYGGISWVPQHAAAYVDNFFWDRLHVWRGTIRDVVISRGTKIQEFHGVRFEKNSSYVRLDGQLSLRDIDFSRAAMAYSIIGDVDTTDTTILNAIASSGNKWAGTPSTLLSGLIDKVNTQTLATAYTIPDVTLFQQHRFTLNASIALALPTAAAGKSLSVDVVQGTGGGFTPTFTGAKWAGGSAPLASSVAGKIDVYTFKCTDGSSWQGFLAGVDVR